LKSSPSSTFPVKRLSILCQQQLQQVLGEPAMSLETRNRLSQGSTPNFHKRWLQVFAVGALLFGIAVKWIMDQSAVSQPERAFPSRIHLASAEVESLTSMTVGSGVAVPTTTGDKELPKITVKPVQSYSVSTVRQLYLLTSD
jgi:hypothetical protein